MASSVTCPWRACLSVRSETSLPRGLTGSRSALLSQRPPPTPASDHFQGGLLMGPQAQLLSGARCLAPGNCTLAPSVRGQPSASLAISLPSPPEITKLLDLFFTPSRVPAPVSTAQTGISRFLSAFPNALLTQFNEKKHPPP